MIQVDDPGKISAAWRDGLRAIVDYYGEDAMRKAPKGSHDAMLRAMHDSVQELRVVITSMLTVLSHQRPPEAQDVADLVKRSVTPREARTGFLAEALQVLDKK